MWECLKDTFPTGYRMLDNMKVNGENGEPKIKEILLFIKKYWSGNQNTALGTSQSDFVSVFTLCSSSNPAD